MAHSDSARKRIRQNLKANLHNRIVKSELRSRIKDLRLATQAAKPEAAALMAGVESRLDKAAKRHIIPHGRANRLKARLKRAAARATKSAA